MEIKINQLNRHLNTLQNVDAEAALSNLLSGLECKIYPAVLHQGEQVVTVINYGGVWYQAWHQGNLVASGSSLDLAHVRVDMDATLADAYAADDFGDEIYPDENEEIAILEKIQEKVPGVKLFDDGSGDYGYCEAADEMVSDILADGRFFDIAEEVYSFPR